METGQEIPTTCLRTGKWKAYAMLSNVQKGTIASLKKAHWPIAAGTRAF